MLRTYYFISDLHIGGDESLGVCDFEKQLIEFLELLESKQDEEIELVIVGDAFGLWEFTLVEGRDKLGVLLNQFPNIFNAFKKVGEKIKITLLPGNHDYELACYTEFVGILKNYNIHLEQTASIIRVLSDHQLYIEHGNQYDQINRMPDFGNPYAQPFGYHVTSKAVGAAGQISEKGKYNWLKDIQSVYPTEDIPHWLVSNYFYKEMSPYLRIILLQFLFLFSVNLIVLIGAGLDVFHVTETNLFLNNRIFESLGFFGSLFQLLLTVNLVVLVLILIFAIPVGLITRDIKKTINRFGIIVDPSELVSEKESKYLDAAKEIFENNSKIKVFIYGHTHSPSITVMGGKAVVNTGTWMKQYQTVKSHFGYLPKIYIPSYRLNYFCIFEEIGEINIEYHKIDKKPVQELTLIQRLLTFNHKPSKVVNIPERTILDSVSSE
ncbi:MAG: metallophosphoesterase [Thermodesulfobacteriota bacterium]